MQQVALAFPPPVLAVLLPGARCVGLRAHPDGTVVTPGQLMAAVRRVLHGQKAMSIPEALASYGRVFGPLACIVSPRAVDIWGTMLSQLKQLQQEIGGQVGILTPPHLWALGMRHSVGGSGHDRGAWSVTGGPY